MAYNLFSNDKQRNYPGYQPTGQVVQQPDFQSSQSAVAPRVAGQPGNVVTNQPVVTTPTRTLSVNPNSSQSGMDLLSSLYTSPDEENRLRKASVAKQRVFAIGDALRHIGNIYNTTKGAPAQQLGSAVAEESQRYQQERALRDARNQRYLSYQQQKAVQDARMQQLAAQQANAERDYRFKVEKDARDAAEAKRRNDAIIANYANIVENRNNTYQHKVDADNRRLAISQQNADTSRMRANKVGTGRSGRSAGSTTGGFTQTQTKEYDELGRVKSTKTVKTPTGTYDQQQKKQLPGMSNGNSGKKKLP